MKPESSGGGSEGGGRRVGLADLLGAGLLLPQDVLVVEGIEGRQQTASVAPDGRITVAGQLFDSVSPAALRAMELAGKSRKAVNGWTAFRVLRSGNLLGTLFEMRGQYEDQKQDASNGGDLQEAVTPSSDCSPLLVLALEQLKPLLGLLPELTANVSKSSISLYAGKLVVAYAYPRKTGLPRLRAYVGDTCPDWATPDPTYAAWCYSDDWSTNVSRVVALLKDSPHRRAEEMAAGRDAYRRRVKAMGGLPTSMGE